MSAHRPLLPALLLLLAAVDYSTSEEVPPYLTSRSAGDPSLVGDVRRSIKFQIPSGKLYAQYNPAEACPPNSRLVRVEVKVWDYQERVQVFVSGDRMSVEVTRAPPAPRAARVRLDVVCSY